MLDSGLQEETGPKLLDLGCIQYLELLPVEYEG